VDAGSDRGIRSGAGRGDAAVTEQNVTIELKLPLNYVNVIMAALGKQPFEQVADVVAAIREQAIPQLPVPQVDEMPANAGGTD